MDKTFVACALCIVVVVLSLFCTLAYVSTSRYAAMQDMVAKGANPQAVACAMNGVDNMNQQVCTALAINERKVN